MTKDTNICPYTGLRSFTEEESLYFKGRDEQIVSIAKQLEEKKFLMVTGASGDGKSSLIFAGLIPQARAGFFKATYSNWYVASFRPERTPLVNLVKALATELQIDDAATASVELSRGFASLIELYKSSPRFIQEDSHQWIEASPDKRSEMERRAGNLLIIVDQFEEFFTNPENFPNGVPSQESRLLLNTLLETTKIALRDNLPIYIVCTMRSDYIGQCAAFRGLPEFIGFSQFFVPRLQRKELLQVIEEPTILSGNRISKRLIDRLIVDLEEAEDQLPTLQHALKQIWISASEGSDEMDLIHYAKVGGMSGSHLPKENQPSFLDWKRSLPDYELRFLENPGLPNVLDIHANKLYYEATAYYNQGNSETLTEKEVKFIIAIAFACLTRIDENRAVRNRVTLEEITQVINVPKLTVEIVGKVLNIFREPQHTLVRPFIDDVQKDIQGHTVLDITHEALIRNWKLLKKWAAKELEYYNVYLDFKQQLNRWVESGKSPDYLLPIGPLTFFENWYVSCRPNAYWINRYNDVDTDPVSKLSSSKVILAHTKEYLRKSKLNLIVTRTFMRYGARRIAAMAGLLIVVGLSGFITLDWWKKQNDTVLQNIFKEGEIYLSDKEAAPIVKADFVINAERLRPGYLKTLLKTIPTNQHKIDISLSVAGLIFNRNKFSGLGLRNQAISYADSLVRSSTPSNRNNSDEISQYLNNLNDVIRYQTFFWHFNQDKDLYEKLMANVSVESTLLIWLLDNKAFFKQIDQKAFHIALGNALNFKAFTATQLDNVIQTLSPLEKGIPIEKFNSLFPIKESITVGFNGKVTHNGVYEKLAYLYASVGNAPKVKMCLDSIHKYNKDYDKNFSNATSIGAYFLIYEFKEAFHAFVKDYAVRLKTSPHLFMKEIVTRAGIFDLMNQLKEINHGNYNDNLSAISMELSSDLFGLYEEIIKTEIQETDEQNFLLALIYKHQAVLLDKKFREQKVTYDYKLIDSLFQHALQLYRKVSMKFLNEKIGIIMQPALGYSEKKLITRKSMFLYPDHFKTLEPTSPNYDSRFYGAAFFYFLKRNNLFSEFYEAKEDYDLLIQWVSSYFELKGELHPQNYFNRSALNYPELSHTTFFSLDSLIEQSGFQKELDDAWIKMQLILDYFGQGDTLRAFTHSDNLKFNKFIKEVVLWTEEYPFENHKVMVAKELALHGRVKQAYQIIARFQRAQNRAVFYSKLAALTYNKNYKLSMTLLDSARNEFGRIKDYTLPFDFIFGIDIRTSMVEIQTMLNDNESRSEALELIGSMFTQKIVGIATMVRTYARSGQYYQATTAIPPLANPRDRLALYAQVLYQEVHRKKTSEDQAWKEYDKDYQEFLDFTYFRYDTY